MTLPPAGSEPASPDAGAAPKAPRSRARRWLFRLLAVLGVLLLGLLAGEVLVRALWPQRLSVPMLEPFEGLLVPRPNLEGRDFAPGEFDVRVRTNAQRMRGSRPTSLAPAPGTLRIAVLGDSFTLGVGAEDDETYPACLERALGSSPPVEVLNAGIFGTGARVQALYYQRWVRRFKPSLVVLSVYANDVADVLREREALEVPEAERGSGLRALTHALPGYSALAQRSHLLNLGRAMATRALTQRGQGAGPALNQTEQNKRLREGRLALAVEVASLANEVRRDGARFALVFVPPRAHVRGEDPASAALANALGETSTQLGLPFLDLTADLRAAHAKGEALYLDRDQHARPLGYQRMGEAVAEWLRATGSLAPPD